MKFYINLPQQSSHYLEYVSFTQTLSGQFRKILEKNIQPTKLPTRGRQLNKCSLIQKVSNKDLDLLEIMNQIIDSFQWGKDLSGKCMICISDNIVANGTNTPLTRVLRIIEFGTETVAPMNWIIPSWRELQKLSVILWNSQLKQMEGQK